MALEVGDIIPIYVGDRKTLGQVKTLGNAGGEVVVVEVPEDPDDYESQPCTCTCTCTCTALHLRRELARLKAISEHMLSQDDCLIAITDRRPLPTKSLRALPPWRAALLAQVADQAGVSLEQGALAQLVEEATTVGGDGELGEWWKRPSG